MLNVCHHVTLGRVGGLRFSPGVPGLNGAADSYLLTETEKFRLKKIYFNNISETTINNLQSYFKSVILVFKR